jgi:hypothetical protein
MQELIRLVVNRTGLSHELASVVVRMTLDFIKSKLPPAQAHEIERIIRSSDASEELRIYIGNPAGEKQTEQRR